MLCLRARGVVGYHARLAPLLEICERGPVQSRTCPFFYPFCTFSTGIRTCAYLATWDGLESLGALIHMVPCWYSDGDEDQGEE